MAAKRDKEKKKKTAPLFLFPGAEQHISGNVAGNKDPLRLYFWVIEEVRLFYSTVRSSTSSSNVARLWRM